MLPTSTTPSEVEDFLREQTRMIKILQDQRVAIHQDFSEKMRQLLERREVDLARNAHNLKKLGVADEDIKTLPADVVIEKRRSNRLSHSQIKQSLTQFMEIGEGYPSPVLTEHLEISYPVFKKFVMANLHFIEPVGTNKGRYYKRKAVEYPQGQE
jgi:DNA gyrase/topoisomerase IV subunit A